MGMYGTIGGQDFKLKGLLARACKAEGIDAEQGICIIPKAQYSAVLSSMASILAEDGAETRGERDYTTVIEGQKIYSLLSDVQVYTAFFNMVTGYHGDDVPDELVFA